MQAEQHITPDLPLTTEDAAAVAGGAAELGEGSFEVALHEVTRLRTRHASDLPDTAPNRWQVLRNDQF